MNELQIFNSGDFGEIRTVEVDGKVCFLGKDVAGALGYKDATNAIKQHCRGVVKHHLPHPQNPAKILEVNIIPEGDVYRLIANSQLPNAQKFEAWIFDEVLPSIRKHGGYSVREEPLSFEQRLKAIEIISTLQSDKLPYAVGLLQPYLPPAPEKISRIPRTILPDVPDPGLTAFMDESPELENRPSRDVHTQYIAYCVAAGINPLWHTECSRQINKFFGFRTKRETLKRRSPTGFCKLKRKKTTSKRCGFLLPYNDRPLL
jgi:anti-repressor protein